MWGQYSGKGVVISTQSECIELEKNFEHGMILTCAVLLEEVRRGGSGQQS